MPVNIMEDGVIALDLILDVELHTCMLVHETIYSLFTFTKRYQMSCWHVHSKLNARIPHAIEYD